MREREQRTVLSAGARRAGAPCLSCGRALKWGPKSTLQWAHAGARPFQRLTGGHQVLGRGRTKFIARTRGRADAPRRGRERAVQLGSFGQMWPSSPRGRAKAITRERGGSIDKKFGNFRSCGRATRMENFLESI
ncbi:hypothetical protein PIB30_051922 [Stylosanthes scabra]|uniref:Uncharacterized protein n=1 Tax=Stylosanthes scabra TaxID=79078 RepID=A0ABU6RIP0_9FABA|nr:hypothetical protein [Stylosanthes scabra]